MKDNQVTRGHMREGDVSPSFTLYPFVPVEFGTIQKSELFSHDKIISHEDK